MFLQHKLTLRLKLRDMNKYNHLQQSYLPNTGGFLASFFLCGKIRYDIPAKCKNIKKPIDF